MNQTLTIPTSLKDITLSNYVKFLKISESNTDELFINQKMIQIFTGLELSYVDKMASTDFIDIASQLQKVLAETPELINRFTLNNVDYGFIPDFEKLTLGEFIDLDNALGDWSKLSEIMSVLYRPIKESKGNQYTIQSYTGEQQPFENMPLDVVLGSMVFFWSLSNQLLEIIPNYLKEVVKDPKIKKTLQDMGSSVLNGVGMSQFLHSQEDLLKIFHQRISKVFIPPSII